MLEVCRLERRLKGLTLSVPELRIATGEVFVLLGPTGAGKSRLLETLAGFAAADRGEVLLEGRDLLRQPVERRGVALVFQDPQLFPHLDVRSNILYGARDGDLFERLINLLKMHPHLDKPVQALSGGERQLTAAARALMTRPRILLLDEPFAAVDAESRRGVIDALRRVQRELGFSLLMVTHDFEEALSMGDRMGVLISGRLVQTGAPQDVFAFPATPEVARFLGAVNLFRGRIEGGQGPEPTDPSRPVLFESQGVRLRAVSDREGEGYALIHPEEITLSVQPLSSSALNQLKGKVTEIRRRSSVIDLRVAAGLDFRVYITPQSLGDLQLVPGVEVYLSFKATAVRIMG